MKKPYTAQEAEEYAEQISKTIMFVNYDLIGTSIKHDRISTPEEALLLK